MEQKEITFDKFIRWSGMILLVIATILLVKYLSEVLIPFLWHGFCLLALSHSQVY